MLSLSQRSALVLRMLSVDVVEAARAQPDDWSSWLLKVHILSGKWLSSTRQQKKLLWHGI